MSSGFVIMRLESPRLGAAVRLISGFVIGRGVIGAGAAVAATAVSDDAVREAAQRELSSLAYQKELPLGDTQPGLTAPELPLELFEALAWIAIGIVAVVALVWLARMLADRRFRPVADDDSGSDHQSASPRGIAVILAEADGLARDGRYAEAVHVLLIAALARFAERGARFVRPALTSREVLARAPLRGEARAALVGLVDVVERAHFAGRPIGRDDYDHCRRGYQTVVAEALGTAS